MNFFYIINATRIKKLIIVITAALFTSVFLFAESNLLQTSVFSTKDGPRAIYKNENQRSKIALTFDISWGDEKAALILDQLKRNGIKNSTFFLSASWAERHPDIVKRIKEDGHEIATMGYDYRDYTSLEQSKVQQDLSKSKKVFDSLGIKELHLLRPPSGRFDKNVLKAAHNFGYTVVHWSVNSKDWINPGVEEIVKNVTDEMEGGDIILLHASDSAQQTEAALPLIIQEMKRQGLVNVTVSELISDTNVKSKEIN